MIYFIFISIISIPRLGRGSRRLHSTIRFSIDDNVNILTPCHTKFTKLASF